MSAAMSRWIAACLLGAALVLSLAAGAQALPITAPTGEFPVDPERGAKPAQSTATGPTSQPGWNHPPQAWEPASEAPQYASLPGRDTNILIQVTGREWRAFHNGPLVNYGGWLIALVAASILAFYLVKGPIRLHGPPTGRTIERFRLAERALHWTMAATFVVMAITGCAILWGKDIVLPWLGYAGFSWLIVVSKTVHNLAGPLFVCLLALFALMFVRDNLWRAYDLQWLRSFGGLLGGTEPASGRFNAGEKAWFWGGLVLLGALVSASGLVLDFPNFNQGRPIMQLANTLHAIGAILFIAASFGHIYLGTIGMHGAFGAMRDGHVDEQWARQHHALWYEEMTRARRGSGR